MHDVIHALPYGLKMTTTAGKRATATATALAESDGEWLLGPGPTFAMMKKRYDLGQIGRQATDRYSRVRCRREGLLLIFSPFIQSSVFFSSRDKDKSCVIDCIMRSMARREFPSSSSSSSCAISSWAIVSIYCLKQNCDCWSSLCSAKKWQTPSLASYWRPTM